MGTLTPIVAQAAGASNSAIILFSLYTVAVFAIAMVCHRMLQRRKSFLGEYYLGSRNLGTIAFAFTFAATSASVGTFQGFPAKIYTHGWIVGLWIASYMIFPLTTMGVLGKRLNQVARKTGAITLPDLLRERFESRAIGIIASLMMLIFLMFFLIPQFKGGSLMLSTLLQNVPVYDHAVRAIDRMTEHVPILSNTPPGYLLCLVLFAASVVFYTSFGGFRAVVWTDVMQAMVMGAGVLIMLVIALSAIGSLSDASKQLSEMAPPLVGKGRLQLSTAAPEGGRRIPQGTLIAMEDADGATKLFRTNDSAVIKGGEELAPADALVRITQIIDESQVRDVIAREPVARDVTVSQVDVKEGDRFKPYAHGAEQPGAYVTGPGPSADSTSGFLPVGLAISFFVMWAITGIGQPGNMVRLMAYDRMATLKRGIIVVTVFFGLIYLPLVFIFCYARVLSPGWDANPDYIMPHMCVQLANYAEHPWLAGLLVAAPFAAAMSTVDSFMLMISSALVRDLWQRNLQPDMSEKATKRASYLVTATIGVVIMLLAVNPPLFLQDVIVFASTGLAASFLMPIAMALYWPRVNTQGAIAAIVGGFTMVLALHVMNMVLHNDFKGYSPFGVDPVIWGLSASLITGIVVTLLTPPPAERVVKRFFHK